MTPARPSRPRRRAGPGSRLQRAAGGAPRQPPVPAAGRRSQSRGSGSARAAAAAPSGSAPVGADRDTGRSRHPAPLGDRLARGCSRPPSPARRPCCSPSTTSRPSTRAVAPSRHLWEPLGGAVADGGGPGPPSWSHPSWAALQRVAPAGRYRGQAWRIREGDEVLLEILEESLGEFGYSRREPVEMVGQFAVRGGHSGCLPSGIRPPRPGCRCWGTPSSQFASLIREPSSRSGAGRRSACSPCRSTRLAGRARACSRPAGSSRSPDRSGAQLPCWICSPTRPCCGMSPSRSARKPNGSASAWRSRPRAEGRPVRPTSTSSWTFSACARRGPPSGGLRRAGRGAHRGWGKWTPTGPSPASRRRDSPAAWPIGSGRSGPGSPRALQCW